MDIVRDWWSNWPPFCVLEDLALPPGAASGLRERSAFMLWGPGSPELGLMLAYALLPELLLGLGCFSLQSWCPLNPSSHRPRPKWPSLPEGSTLKRCRRWPGLGLLVEPQVCNCLSGSLEASLDSWDTSVPLFSLSNGQNSFLGSDGERWGAGGG